MNEKIKSLIEHYKLQPLPVEGTLFTSTYRSPENLPNGKPFGTAMIGMYCHEPKSISYFHKLTIDEVWHFYDGDPLRLILLFPNGMSKDIILGNDLSKNQLVQFVIPAGVWQAGHTLGEYSLFGCTLAPGFTDEIFTGGSKEELLRLYPNRKEDISNYGLDGEIKMPDGFAN